MKSTRDGHELFARGGRSAAASLVLSTRESEMCAYRVC